MSDVSLFIGNFHIGVGNPAIYSYCFLFAEKINKTSSGPLVVYIFSQLLVLLPSFAGFLSCQSFLGYLISEQMLLLISSHLNFKYLFIESFQSPVNQELVFVLLLWHSLDCGLIIYMSVSKLFSAQRGQGLYFCHLYRPDFQHKTQHSLNTQ